MMCVPLKLKKGVVIGVVQLINKTASGVFYNSEASLKDESRPSFTPQDLKFLQVFASQAAAAVANSEAMLQEIETTPSKSQKTEPRDCWNTMQEDEIPLGEDCLNHKGFHTSHIACRADKSHTFGEKVQSHPCQYDLDAKIDSCKEWFRMDDGSGEKAKDIAGSLENEYDCNWMLGHKIGKPLATTPEDTSRSLCARTTVAVDAIPSRVMRHHSFHEEDNSRRNSVESVASADPEQRKKKTSGRTRQRRAKFYASIRQRTPSPEVGSCYRLHLQF
jgi:hypothetical protein